MNNEQQPCMREDLHCWVQVSHQYTVDDDGNPAVFMNSTADDTSGLDEYGCWNCDSYWGFKCDDKSRMKAWRAAIAHVNPTSKQESAA